MSEMSESDATASGSAEAEITIGDGVEGGGRAGATSSTYGTCGLCGIVFPTTRGASQHERLVHPRVVPWEEDEPRDQSWLVR